MQTMDSAGLSYLEASRVAVPAGDLSTLDLENSNGEKLGKLDGLLIDVAQRRVRFFVVAPKGTERRRYLLRPDVAALQVDQDRNALRMQTAPEDLAQCPQFRSASVRDYSDDDMIAAIFS